VSLQACHVLSHRQLDQEFCVIASAGKIQGEFFNTIGRILPLALAPTRPPSGVMLGSPFAGSAQNAR
jgi:hypothetical protein